MQSLRNQLAVIKALRKLQGFNMVLEKGRAQISFNDAVKKSDIIIAVEATGNLIKYSQSTIQV